MGVVTDLEGWDCQSVLEFMTPPQNVKDSCAWPNVVKEKGELYVEDVNRGEGASRACSYICKSR